MGKTTAATVEKTSDAIAAHKLAHLIPGQEFLDNYVTRQIAGRTDLAVLQYARTTHGKVLMMGPTGPGKTSSVLAFGAWKKLPVCTVQCHGAVDPATFWGGLVLDPDSGKYVWRDSEVTEVIKHGGILYLDEINFLPPKVASVFNGLLDARRQVTILENGNELIHAHEDLFIVASYNPDYEGTKRLNEALKNRFNIKIDWDYDPAVEKQLVGCQSLHELASKLRGMHRTGDIETPTSTNMLIEFETIATDIDLDFARLNFLAAFSADERPAVSNAIDLYMVRLKAELDKITKSA